MSASPMRVLWLTCALVLAAPCLPAGADDQSVQASVSGDVVSGIIVQIRTSDFGAASHTCTTGDGIGCTVTDPQSAVPKNIGNLLSIPQSIGGYTIDGACKTLLQETSGCQKNSALPPSTVTTSYVAPVCNYTTSATASTSAYWYWTVQRSNSGVMIKCTKDGYGDASK